MSWIPGWDSVGGAHFWSNIFFWASISALILLGVFEVLSHRYSERKDELAAIEQADSQRQHDDEMTRLHLETAQAQERAAQAQLELGKYRAPRVLTAEQQRAIEEALRPFAGQQYALSVAPGIEPAALLCVLDGVLSRAGWIQHAAIGSVTVGTDCGTAALNGLSGIDARRGPDATPATIAAINALGAALAPTEAAARLATDPVNNQTRDVIILMVGAKS